MPVPQPLNYSDSAIGLVTELVSGTQRILDWVPASYFRNNHPTQWSHFLLSSHTDFLSVVIIRLAFSLHSLHKYSAYFLSVIILRILSAYIAYTDHHSDT